jgi:hypothetical protein
MMSILFASVTEPGRMPFFWQMAFMTTGIVLLLVTSVRSWQSRREWKVKSVRGPRTRHRLSPAMRLEVSLETVGALICWAVAEPDWRFRVLFAGAALFGIVITLYRIRSETKQMLTFDDASVLHVEPQGTSALPSKG